jgi:hypothetical protein
MDCFDSKTNGLHVEYHRLIAEVHTLFELRAYSDHLMIVKVSGRPITMITYAFASDSALGLVATDLRR